MIRQAFEHVLSLLDVMLLNIGSVGGPTDGTGLLARRLDSRAGPVRHARRPDQPFSQLGCRRQHLECGLRLEQHLPEL